MTTTNRRILLAGGGALLLFGLPGCAPAPAEAPPPAEAEAGPGSVTIAATGSAGMNPGPDGADRPITLTVLQLRATPSFETADFFALQSPETALGADLVSATQVALAPGATAQTTLELDPSTTAVGIVGGYRDPAGKSFRVVTPVTPGEAKTLAVGVTASGVTAQPA